MRATRLGLIYGSTREGRFCDTIVNWVMDEMTARGGFALDIIDPRALGLPAWNESGTPGIAALRERLRRAEAFVVVTPELNHGYPAPLKYVIDAAFSEWHAKPVAFVCYGGVSGGLRAVEQLRLVFAELHAVTLRDTVSFANPWDQFDAHGGLSRPEVARAAMAILLARLEWWARVLGQGRDAAPYGDAVVGG